MAEGKSAGRDGPRRGKVKAVMKGKGSYRVDDHDLDLRSSTMCRDIGEGRQKIRGDKEGEESQVSLSNRFCYHSFYFPLINIGSNSSSIFLPPSVTLSVHHLTRKRAGKFHLAALEVAEAVKQVSDDAVACSGAGSSSESAGMQNGWSARWRATCDHGVGEDGVVEVLDLRIGW
jgi:hypothetical protein